jgi:hypothetical protein|tara:strand:- start:373 stop:591 length:219 start_codon:yes stop_codon:yes gene_type:complete
MSTTDVIKNYSFLDNIIKKPSNIIKESGIEFKYFDTKKYEEQYSFDLIMQNIKNKKDTLEKKQKINYLIFKE